jgi:hypothetical protein
MDDNIEPRAGLKEPAACFMQHFSLFQHDHSDVFGTEFLE